MINSSCFFNIDVWTKLLRNYSGSLLIHFNQIMRFGAQIDYLKFNVLIIFKNLFSVDEVSKTIIIKIQKDVKMQRIEKITFIHFFISSFLGLMLKSNEKWWRIHYLSHSKESSINDGISLKIKKLKYVKFQEILNFIFIVEFDCLIMKKNIKNVNDCWDLNEIISFTKKKCYFSIWWQFRFFSIFSAKGYIESWRHDYIKSYVII